MYKRKNKKVIKEAPEEVEVYTPADSNKRTSDIQNCATEISALKSQVEELMTTTLDDNDSNTLELMKNKLDYVNSILNNLIKVEVDTPEEVIEEDDSSTNNADGTVNMTVDSVIQTPDVVKKLSDKQIGINLTDDNGNSLIENRKRKIIRATLRHLKSKGLLKSK